MSDSCPKRQKEKHGTRCLVLFWWAMRDSNPHWIGYEPTALTVKLMARMKMKLDLRGRVQMASHR